MPVMAVNAPKNKIETVASKMAMRTLHLTLRREKHVSVTRETLI